MTLVRPLRVYALCAPTWAVALVVCAFVLGHSRALAEPCAFADIAPKQKQDAVAVFAEGRAYANQGRYSEARAMYRWLLKIDSTDREAQLALARLDAWERCFERAERQYQALLETRPHDVEARAGLIDVLLWNGRWSEARAAIDVGLRLDPKAAELWQRRAHLLQWTGDRQLAVEAADRAEALAPKDIEIREFRDQLFVGQLRASARIDDAFSRAYPSLYTADLQALNYWHKFELAAEAQLRARYGGGEKVVDGLYSAGAAYHSSGGTSVGLGLGFGAPSVSVPWLQTRAWVSTQLDARWSGYLAYSFWQYRNDKTVHILAPVLGYAVNDWILVELRAWASYLVLPPPAAQSATAVDSASRSQAQTQRATGAVFAAGARTTFHVLAPLTLGASYTFGPQLDQAPAQYQLVRLTSHIFSVFADWLVSRDWGLQPMLGFERRESENGAVVLIFTAEAASYLRW